MGTIQGRGVLAALLVGVAAGVGAERAVDRQPEVAGLRIVVNTAAKRLYVYENGERTRTYRVAVGKRGHRTPTGSYAISRVVWNPWWHPPNRGWARGEKVTPPGPSNPMGRVKMYFRNLYYIHGTPYEGSLGRAVSHGCVRMSNGDAIELARLVHRYGGGASESTIDRLVRNRKATREIWLKRRVPVEIVSRSAEVYDGRLEIYASNGSYTEEEVRREALMALRAAGFDLEKLDRARLRALVTAARSEMVTVPLSELEVPGPAYGLVRGS